MDSVTISVHQASFGYTITPVLHDIDLTFAPGTVHGIVGPNGSGKSTLLDLMSGHRVPTQGRIAINDSPISDIAPDTLARQTALVEQQFDFNFPFTVREAVLMGRHPHIPRFARPSDTDIDHVRQALTITDTTKLADRVLADLSGGEKQRTVFARALAQDTPALLLDEPTSSMDVHHALAVMTELKRLAHEEGRTIVTVLHDLSLAATFCDRIVMLKLGQVFADGMASDVLTSETISDVFAVRAEVIETNNGPTISYGLKDND